MATRRGAVSRHQLCSSNRHCDRYGGIQEQAVIYQNAAYKRQAAFGKISLKPVTGNKLFRTINCQCPQYIIPIVKDLYNGHPHLPLQTYRHQCV
jgi:hypothetical protein